MVLSRNFELEDVPDYLARFPVLRGKAQLGRGEYSVVFEGCCPNTALKLTADSTTVEFLLAGRLQGCVGIVEFIEYHGCIESKEHSGGVHLIELKRLKPIECDIHFPLYCERESVIATIRHRIIESDRFKGIVPTQERHAGALQELSLSNLFSDSISKALSCIAQFMKSSTADLLHDLCNPANYMTDGTRLIITDPLVTIPD